jgi:uncharacterized protein (TIGR03437 family)
MRTWLVYALLLFAPAAWAASGLTYSTYLRDGFTPSAIATDSAGNVYLAGSTIVDAATSQTAAMVVKLDPTGGQYLYVRTFGGSGFDTALGIAVDSAGDAYVAGNTSSPDFPITPGSQTGTLPANQTRAFLVKLDPQGELLFSDVLGNVSTTGLAVALAADGGILVSGISNSSGLAASGGAYSVPDSNGRPYLMKLDAAGSNVVFTATGIGGDALVVDAAGNIYMAGSAFYYYPTTPGAYQTFPNPSTCPECFFAAVVNQYVTKVDPGASKLIYSTGVAGNSSTSNHGLAVDAAGNAYVTGVSNGGYNWTGTQPNSQLVQPFLTKLDGAGANALYSIAVGGAGVALGSQGDVYVGGAYNDINVGFTPPVILPSLPLGITSLPARCQTNSITTFSEAYVSHVDATTGNVLSTVLVDGSNVSAAGVAFAGGSSVWIAGPTTQADTPITPGALTPADGLHAGPQAGAYLGEVNFGLSQAAGPRIACVVDNANEARIGVVAPGQLLTLFGTGLGPATGVAATGYSTTSLAGVTVTFDDMPGTLLYVSSSQINVAVPYAEPFSNSQGAENFSTMQVSVNGVAAPPRALPVVPSNPSLFGDLSGTVSSCTVGDISYYGAFTDLALNADGTLNSCLHRATPGAVISLFVNGLGVDCSCGTVQAWVPSQIPVAVTIGQWSAEVVNVSSLNPFMWQVDVRVPAAAAESSLFLFPVTMDMNFTNGVMTVGPLAVQPGSPSYATPATPFPLTVWVSP